MTFYQKQTNTKKYSKTPSKRLCRYSIRY